MAGGGGGGGGGGNNAGTVLQIAGTFMKLIGIWTTAYEEDREDDLAAADAKQNAQRARWSAGDARTRGDSDATVVALAGGQLEAKQKVAYANSGVVSSTGTAAETQANTAALTRLDARQTQNNAMREAFGHQVVAANYDNEAYAHLERKKYRAAKTVLTSVGTVFGDMGGSMGGMSSGDAQGWASAFGGGGGGG